MRLTPVQAIALGAALALVTTSCSQLEHLPHLTKADLRFAPAESSQIYASNGQLITTLHGAENRTLIHSLRRIPKRMQNAVIAIEDQRYYQHGGVDPHAIFRALLANITSGSIQQGGSTITQQYVKNAIIAPGKAAAETIKRKIDEAALAMQLEKKLTKKQILLRYLNTVYFGEGAYGIEAAAKTFFGKDISHLDLAESATLAGQIQSPENFDPFRHGNASKARRHTVLQKMLQLGWAKPGPVQKAERETLKLKTASASDRYPAPYFIDYVQRLLTYDPRFKALGTTVADRTKSLFRGGLRIYTTVDLKDQTYAEQAVKQELPYASDPHASLVSIDPNTGYVKAMVGGRDWFAAPKADAFSKLNLAILAEPDLGRVKDCGATRYENRAPGCGRQAGSSFKPFALATAVKQGVPLSEQFKAPSCMDFPGADAGGTWHVCNYADETFSGSALSLLEATVFSVNVVFAQLILKVGPQAVVDTARAMGIRTPLLPVPSAVLGTNPVNALDMASAYGTFATNGVHHPPVAITKIVDSNGKTIYKDHSTSTQALDPSVSYITTSALEQVVQRGTGTAAQIGRPEAGKTGTGQSYRDAWFVGYTPDLVTAVWMGYPQGEIQMVPSCSGAITPCIPTRTITSGGVVGGSFPAQMWALYMSKALADVPADNFTAPSVGVTTITIDTRTGCLANRFTPAQYRASATFAKGTAPKQSCRVSGDRVKVPDVFGFPVADAVRILQGAGFTVSQRKQPSTTYPPGRVIGESPKGGSKAPTGSTVTISVSESPGGGNGGGFGGGGGNGGGSGGGNGGGGHGNHGNTATVPDVLGLTRSDAAARIQDAGFVVREITQSESSKGQARKNHGRVWKQQPSGGTSAARGSVVTIWVNPG